MAKKRTRRRGIPKTLADKLKVAIWFLETMGAKSEVEVAEVKRIFEAAASVYLTLLPRSLIILDVELPGPTLSDICKDIEGVTDGQIQTEA